MSTEDRSHRLQLLAASQKMAARRRPTLLYFVLAVLAVFTFSYEVRLTYQNFPEWFGRADAARRPFFADAAGTEPIRISFLTNEAADAGLKSGDELVAVNGRPAVGTAVFGEAMHAARVGDVLRVIVRRQGETSERTASITLRSGSVHYYSVWFVMALTLVVIVPLLSLGIGFWVAAVRPRDPLAWLLLAFLAAFAVFYNADAEAWGPVVRDLAVIYRFGVEAFLPMSAVLFGIYFPEPFPRQGRWRWWYRLMWVLLVPSILVGLALTIDEVGDVENRAAVMGLDRGLAVIGTALPGLLILACCLTFFAALAVKWRLATSVDGKRRLSLMFWGTVLGMGPLAVLQAVASLKNQQLEIYFPWWVFVPAYLLTALVPVTFAYVIVVQRAMDVRLVLRQGLIV